MSIVGLIKTLKESGLYAQCPCGGEFKLSESLLFDGTKSFPEEAKDLQKMLLKDLKDREESLKKRKKLATVRAEKTTVAVNLGKEMEKILPTLKDFKWRLADSRFLADPIDLIIFNGLSLNKIESINFIEIKSGASRLNNHQKAVKDAVEDKRVSYKEYK